MEKLVEKTETGVNGSNADHENEPNANAAVEAEPSSLIVVNENRHNHFLRLVRVDLVMEQLVRFLSLKDMKSLSVVSQDCLSAVRNTEYFGEKTILVMSRESICRINVEGRMIISPLSIFSQTTNFPWKNVLLDLSLPVENVQYISNVLENASAFYIGFWNTHSDWIKKSKASRILFLSKVFENAKNIRKLDLEVGVVMHFLPDFFTYMEVQELLNKLESLEIRGMNIKNRVSLEEVIDRSLGDEGQGSKDVFHGNNLQLSQLPLKLKRLAISHTRFDMKGNHDFILKFTPDLISASRGTLEKLRLHWNVWKSEQMETICCPKLWCLNTACRPQKISTLEKFIKNQPPLAELILEMDLSSLKMLLGLKPLLRNLKTFHISITRHNTRRYRAYRNEDSLDWSFLEAMLHLKDFSVRDDDSEIPGFGNGEKIIGKLSSTVQQILMWGVYPFWAWTSPSPQTDIGLLMARFENLKTLTLLASPDSVTDEGLQSLIRKCPKLTILELYSYFLTDFGITGIRKGDDGEEIENTGISLAELKGLRELAFKRCDHVTSEGLLAAVKFNDLRSFNYFIAFKVEKEFLFQIVRQNPRLENVYINLARDPGNPSHDEDVTQEVRKLNPHTKLEIIRDFWHY